MSQSNVVTETAAVPRFRDAYQTMLAEMRALPDDELMIVNLDIPTAVTTVLGALLPGTRTVLAIAQSVDSRDTTWAASLVKLEPGKPSITLADRVAKGVTRGEVWDQLTALGLKLAGGSKA